MTFTIIIPHYQPTVSDKQLDQCMKSIRLQRMDEDIEVLLYHDGPLKHNCRYPIVATKKRANDWGHSLRDLGIEAAKGEYIVHLNPDNILYPKALKKLRAKIKETGNRPIYIMWLLMSGVITRRAGDHYEMARTFRPEDRVILKGDPKPGLIDAMQLVMKTDLWREYGGWYDKQIHSDALMYERFCKEHEPYRYELVIGEHR